MMLAASAPKKCSLVIPTKNGGALFQEVVLSLTQQTIWPEVEFIVVDSGSTDSTIQIAKSAGATIIEIAPSDFNHGATRDLGVSTASNELVVLMVQDAILEGSDALEILLSSFEDPQVAGAYARQKPRADADLLTKRNLNNWLTGREVKEVRQIQSLDWYNALPPIEKYFFCNFDNVCSAIRKSTWLQQKFGAINFGEDIDWAERVLKMNLRLAFEPGAVVIHSHDRPMSYEYKRTYVCHRKLYRQFGLHLVPRVRDVITPWLGSALRDVRYIAAQEAPWTDKLAYWLKIPLLNLLSALAQYRAARDEKSGIQHTVRGV